MSDVTEAMVEAAVATYHLGTQGFDDLPAHIVAQVRADMRRALEAVEGVRVEAAAPDIISDIYPPDRATWDGRNQQLADALALQTGLIEHFGWLDHRRDGDPRLSEQRMLALVIAEVAQAREAGRREGWAAAVEAAARVALNYPTDPIAEAHSNSAVCTNAASNIAAAILALPEPGAEGGEHAPPQPTERG